MRESPDQVTDDFLALDPGEQLLVLRRIVPPVVDRMDKEAMVGFLRDLMAEVAAYERRGGVEGERPLRRPPHRTGAARDEKAWRFLHNVAAEAGLDRADDAAGPVAAVLCALQQRISEREADQMLAQLPEGIRALATCEVHAERATGDRSLDRARFLARVAVHAGLRDVREAERLAMAVLRVTRRWLGEGEAADVASQLPADMEEWLAPNA